MRAAGKKHNVASEHRWALWQVQPVMCAGCGSRVTLKQAFFGSEARGTFHAACAPYRVTLDVALDPGDLVATERLSPVP